MKDTKEPVTAARRSSSAGLPAHAKDGKDGKDGKDVWFFQSAEMETR